MPNLVSETLGTGDQSWIGEPGPWKARSQALTKSTFATTDYPDGYLPSGTPVADNGDGTYGKYADGGTLAGFVLTDTKVSNDAVINVALYDRGRVNVDKLPVDFTPPADPGHFIFLNVPSAG